MVPCFCVLKSCADGLSALPVRQAAFIAGRKPGLRLSTWLKLTNRLRAYYVTGRWAHKYWWPSYRGEGGWHKNSCGQWWGEIQRKEGALGSKVVLNTSWVELWWTGKIRTCGIAGILVLRRLGPPFILRKEEEGE